MFRRPGHSGRWRCLCNLVATRAPGHNTGKTSELFRQALSFQLSVMRITSIRNSSALLSFHHYFYMFYPTLLQLTHLGVKLNRFGRTYLNWNLGVRLKNWFSLLRRKKARRCFTVWQCSASFPLAPPYRLGSWLDTRRGNSFLYVKRFPT